MAELETFPQQLSSAEVDDLPRLFEEFQKVTAELVATHDGLQAEVSSLKAELESKNQRLERKKRLEALGRVAAGVAHEFRNPLGSMRLTVDALLAKEHTERSHARLQHISRAVDHLDHVVGELLTFTRDQPLERERITIGELLESALEMACPDLNGKSLVLEGPEELLIDVDRHAFLQVLVNLLTNALQAVSGKSGRVGLWWGVRNEKFWIEIADEGPGIPKGDEERIFHPFHTSRDDGTGLGLAIAHSRVEAHEGEISVAADAWGKSGNWSGARFRVLLPAQPSETTAKR